MRLKNRTYNQRKRILQKQFKSSMIYTPEEAKTLMETILKEKVDLEFIRRYIEEHDCILIEKKKNRNERNIIQNTPILPILKENSDNKQHRVNPLTYLKTKNANKNIPKVRKSNNQLKSTKSISLETRNELIEKNLNLIRKYANHRVGWKGFI